MKKYQWKAYFSKWSKANSWLWLIRCHLWVLPSLHLQPLLPLFCVPKRPIFVSLPRKAVQYQQIPETVFVFICTGKDIRFWVSKKLLCYIGAPQVSNSSASDSDDAFMSSSASDSDAFRELTSEELLTKISQELQRKMQEFGVDLPYEMTMEYFTCRVVIGEEERGR